MRMRPIRHALLALSLLACPAVLAQETGAAANPGSTETPAPVEAQVPLPAEFDGPAAAAAPTLDERMAAIETKLAGTEETVGALQSTVDGLKKLKIGGFVQGRYEWHQDAVDGWENYKSENRFYVRHGYLGARYDGKYGEYFMQIDANNSDGVVLKDAEASLVDPWTPFHLKLTIGQFKVPFGYEITQSDADREMPERAAVITGLFPGDRDRGLRLQASYEVLRLSVALVNGASFGQKDPTDAYGVVQNGYDPNGFKTVVGRLGADLGFLVGGLSGMWGRTLETGSNPGKGKYDSTSYAYFEQLRLGADVQGYVDVPGVGGLALKGEAIWARKKNLDYTDRPADSCRDTSSFGWMITVIQNIGPYLGFAARLDQFDPLLSGSVESRCYDQKAVANRDKDRVTRMGAAVLLHASANTKFTLSYEHPWEQEGAKKDNDIVVAQMQARF
jgi:hypothetical protein